MRKNRASLFIMTFLICFTFTLGKGDEPKRPMTFMDVIMMKNESRPDISPDEKWAIYTVTSPDWEKNRKFTDIYITPLTGGKTRQMTFTVDKNESSPKWYKDSSFFAFLSNRSENRNQLYFMPLDGGEVKKVTNDKYGVGNYRWSSNYKYLAYLGGNPAERQIWIMPGKGGEAERLTHHSTPVRSYLWNPNSKKIYFTAASGIDRLDLERKERGFNVRIADQLGMPSHLWELDIETKTEKCLTEKKEYSISEFIISDDGTKIAFIGIPTQRYSEYSDSEIYILDVQSNKITQVTNNSFEESHLKFSPNGKYLAFISPSGQSSAVDTKKIYIASTDGGETKRLLHNFEHDAYVSFWSENSEDIYFSAQKGLDYHLFRVSVDTGKYEQITNFGNYSVFFKDEDTRKFCVYYSDPVSPRDSYCCDVDQLNDKSKWVRISDTNPQIKDIQLGEYETIRWLSTDGTEIEGILIKPANYTKDRKYPLIVQIHGGPHDAYDRRFSASGSDYVHIFSANDYVVFQPNYRGSTGYGEKFKRQALEDYFDLPYKDIMTGVDFLIKNGVVDPDKMGVMGWSAGGEYSNWILVKTDCFKAISTGAGTVTFYGWNNNSDQESPLKYLKNAKTPTLIHFGEDDPLMPPRHGKILHNALKKLNVPTEFIIYPNTGHGIYNMRYLMVKMQAEFSWLEKWIKGKEGWIDWKKMLETLKKTVRN